jgi:glucose-6-phosphate isomerase, archaeal
MDTLVSPAFGSIDLRSGVMTGAEVVERRLSSMVSFYRDQEVARALLAEDPVLYRVYTAAQPGDRDGWYVATSVIEPGCVGDEYFMTRGHFHPRDDAPEVYLTLRGEGMLVMQTREGRSNVQRMVPGVFNYIPAGWAHRTVNTGDEPMAFFAVWPVHVGHDYTTLAKRGFARLIVKRPGGPQVIDNPAYTGR